MIKSAAALLVASLVFAAPSFAQDNASITLQVNTGSVMTSDGGDYASAASGQALTAGQKIMINAGGSATATYGNGCRIEFTQPGVYVVPVECKAAGGNNNAGRSSRANAAIIAGTAVLGAAAIDQGKKMGTSGLSTGAR